MKYTIKYEEAEAMVTNGNLTPLESVRADFVLATFYKDSEAIKDYALKHNKKAIAHAVNGLFNANHDCKWEDLVEGVSYIRINHEADKDSEAVKERQLYAWDVFCKKVVKDSHKHEIDRAVFGALNLFGHNMGVEFIEDKSISVKYKKECVAELKMFTKYSDAPKVFFENAESNKGHERQLQFFFDMFYGENTITATKHYVDHLKAKFITATNKGYTDKSEFVLLQLIMNEAYNCKHGVKYNFNSKLTCHKEHKEK